MARHLERGNRGEEIAIGELTRRGYRIIERNYRCRLGEVDVIAVKEGTIVFVEVKTRRSDDYGSPEMSVTARKQRQLVKVALSYLQHRNLLDRDARFDVVAVEFGSAADRVTIIKDAFEVPGS